MTPGEVNEWMGRNQRGLVGDLTCEDAAQAMAVVIASLSSHIEQRELAVLLTVGAVMFREGQKEIEAGRQADQMIQRARALYR